MKEKTTTPKTNRVPFLINLTFPSSRCSVTFLFVQHCKREPIKLLALLAVNNFMVNDAMMNGFHVAGSCPPHTAERDKDRGRVKVERERENQQWKRNIKCEMLISVPCFIISVDVFILCGFGQEQ